MKKNEGIVLVKRSPWNVLVLGAGDPIVVLHNAGGNLWNRARQLQHFFSRCRVIAPDLPGFGRSSRPAGPLTLDSFVEDLGGFLDALGCDRPNLVGNCIGASIALEHALRHPGKVRAPALFNVCGGTPMLTPGLRFWAGLRPRTRLGKTMFRILIEGVGHPLPRRWNARLIYARGEPTLHPDLRRFLEKERCEPAIRASLFQLVMGLERFGDFSRPCEKPGGFPPVLPGWGKQNRTLDVTRAEFHADWLAPDRFCVIEDAGHMPMYDHPGVVNEMLESFLRRNRMSDPDGGCPFLGEKIRLARHFLGNDSTAPALDPAVCALSRFRNENPVPSLACHGSSFRRIRGRFPATPEPEPRRRSSHGRYGEGG